MKDPARCTATEVSEPGGSRGDTASPDSLSGRASELPLEVLEREIAELAAQIAVATARWLKLLAELDRRRGWATWGARSCAHWLSWRCGIDAVTAREHLRVAHALEGLPTIEEAFSAGRLSYSKVRALTRVATPATEEELLEIAEQATAAQTEKLVRAYRRAASTAELEEVNARHARRYVRYSYDDDGSLVLEARLDPEEGALVVAALDAARDPLTKEARRADKGSAETCSGNGHNAPATESDPGRNAAPASGRLVDGHHILHWVPGGEHRLDNLVELCRFYHRLVHEGGYTVTRSSAGAMIFSTPDGRTIPPAPEMRPPRSDLSKGNEAAGFAIDHETMAVGCGDRLDYSIAVEGLLSLERLL